MMIENVESLNNWLITTLRPICDCDPEHLAKYVVTLLQKQESEEWIKDSCIEQLEVLLQQETKPFIYRLFQVLHDKSYMRWSAKESKSSHSSMSPFPTVSPNVFDDLQPKSYRSLSQPQNGVESGHQYADTDMRPRSKSGHHHRDMDTLSHSEPSHHNPHKRGSHRHSRRSPPTKRARNEEYYDRNHQLEEEIEKLKKEKAQTMMEKEDLRKKFEEQMKAMIERGEEYKTERDNAIEMMRQARIEVEVSRMSAGQDMKSKQQELVDENRKIFLKQKTLEQQNEQLKEEKYKVESQLSQMQTQVIAGGVIRDKLKDAEKAIDKYKKMIERMKRDEREVKKEIDDGKGKVTQDIDTKVTKYKEEARHVAFLITAVLSKLSQVEKENRRLTDLIIETNKSKMEIQREMTLLKKDK